MGDLAPGRPWTYMPTASRLYFRKSQLPTGERFRTKMAVEMLRAVDTESAAPVLAAFDGAYAMKTVIKPCLNPPEGSRRIEFVTRLRTFQVQMTALTLLRLMQFRLARRYDDAWCAPPPWNLRKRHVSILDLRRLFWKHRSKFSQVLSALTNLRKPPQTKYSRGQPTSRAA